jgi:hypothetical protein
MRRCNNASAADGLPNKVACLPVRWVTCSARRRARPLLGDQGCLAGLARLLAPRIMVLSWGVAPLAGAVVSGVVLARARGGFSPEGVSSGTALGDHREPSATGEHLRRDGAAGGLVLPPAPDTLAPQHPSNAPCAGTRSDRLITGLSRPLSPSPYVTPSGRTWVCRVGEPGGCQACAPPGFGVWAVPTGPGACLPRVCGLVSGGSRLGEASGKLPRHPRYLPE